MQKQHRAGQVAGLLGLLLLALAASGPVAEAAPCYSFFSKADFPECVELAPNGTVSLAWKVLEGPQPAILWALDADNPSPTGWVSVGLSEAGGMKGSDMVVLTRGGAAGAPLTVTDLWSDEFAAPEEDTQQDWVLLYPQPASAATDGAAPTDGAAANSNSTALAAAGAAAFTAPAQPAPANRILAVVARPLVTCDTQDIPVPRGLSQVVVWALGSAWPRYHGEGNRGNSLITFIQPTPQQLGTLPPAVQAAATAAAEPDPLQRSVDLLMPNVTVPTAETSYLCTHVAVPADTKYHITHTKAFPRSPLVHHMILFGCASPQPPAALGDLFECTSMPAECSLFAIGWAPGNDTFAFPPEAGYAIGSGPGVPRYFVLQTHYNNPGGVQLPGPDNSGFRLFFTPRLRPYDVGVLTLGQTALVIPPGQASFAAPPSVCPAECTSRLGAPLTVLNTLLHMHALGSTIITRHIRGDTELPPLGQRRVWDFNHQNQAPVPYETRQLLPGDVLITSCTYDSTSRTNVTTYGEGTQDEMCFDFLVYYPKQDNVTFCGSGQPPPPGSSPYALCTNSTHAGLVQERSAGTLMTQSKEAVAAAQAERVRKLTAMGGVTNYTEPVFKAYTDPACVGKLVQAAEGGA